MARGLTPRAAVVVTGSELVRGDRRDENGPFLAASLLELGVEPARVLIVGDDASELERALREGLEHDLLVTSGGLGPTHDDRTVEVLGRVLGLDLRVEAELERTIGDRSREVAARLGRPYAEFEAGIVKQASVPDGAYVAGLAGTAPAFSLRTPAGAAAVLPGPPRELQALWPRIVETEPLRGVLARARTRARSSLRLFGVPESTVAQALAEAGGDGDGVDATICARDFEIHVDLVVDEGAAARGEALLDTLAERLAPYLYAREQPIENVVLARLRARGWTLATAESCTGGMVSERLTAVPGSSQVFVGGVVAYADEVKVGELGVPEEVLRTHGAVSAETAASMARGVRERLGASVGVSVTGVAGPDGGTREKPVGLVYVHAAGPEGELAADFEGWGGRETIRRRAAVTALHLVRKLVTESAQT